MVTFYSHRDGREEVFGPAVHAGNVLEVGFRPATIASPTKIQITLTITGPASALTEIVAVDDHGTWVGVSDLGLP